MGLCAPHGRRCTRDEDSCSRHGDCCINPDHNHFICNCHSGWQGITCETKNPDQVQRLNTIAVIGAIVAFLVMAAFLLFVFWIYMVIRKRKLAEKERCDSLMKVELDSKEAAEKKKKESKCPKLQPGFSWRERTIKKSVVRLPSRMSAPVDLDKLDLIPNMTTEGASRPTSQWINTDATRPTSLWMNKTTSGRPTSIQATPCPPASQTSKQDTPYGLANTAPIDITDMEMKSEMIHL